DYTLTQLGNERYLSQFTPEQRSYFESFPTWVEASWAIAIWSAVAGSVLLLLRQRLAAPAFALSLVAMIATALHNFGLADVKMSEIAGPGAIWFSLAILVVGVLSWLYARAMRARGHLQ